jgi:hypothetical protein
MALRRIVLCSMLVLVAAFVLGGATANGAFPGANGRIAVIDFVGEDSLDVVTVEPDGSGLMHHAYPGPFSLDVSWTPDGTSMVVMASDWCFYRVTPGSADVDLLQCATHPTIVRDEYGHYLPTSFSLSPDGSEVVFDDIDAWRREQGGDGISDIWHLDLDTGTTTVLYREDQFCSGDPYMKGAGYPAWSPQGDRIAIFREPFDEDLCGPIKGLWTMAPDGSDLTPVALGYRARDLDWSPDGMKIAFRGWSPSGDSGVFVVDASGGTPTLVASNALEPAWSPDGTKIAFGSLSPYRALHTMDADGSDIQSLGVSGGFPSWQPVLAPPDPDADDDGVADAIQVAPGAFDDGAGTSGAIVDAAGLEVLVEDADDMTDGVKITVGPGSGKATFSICGFTVRVSAGSEVVITCGSVTVEVVEGSAEIALDDPNVVVSVPEGGSAKVTDDGGTFFTVQNLGGTDLTVTADGTSTTVPAGETTSVSTDITDPTVTCNAGSWLLDEPGALVTATVSDGESGPAATPVSAPADTSAPGSHSVEVTGYDQAGNSMTVSCGYAVVYAFQGFFTPVDNLPTVNEATAGQTIPIKWRISNFYGVGVSDSASFVSVTSGSITCDASAPRDAIETYSGGSGLQYLGDGDWQLNWKTPKSYAGQCRTARLNLADGRTGREAEFRFK